VEPRDFCTFVHILAHGSLTQAAAALGMVRRTLDRQVKAWALKGPVHRRMLRLLPGRNASRASEVVSLSTPEEAKAPEEDADAPTTIWERLERTRAVDTEQDYPGLLRDLREAVAGMNAGNWGQVQQELLTVLDEEICPSH
jgi:hypothetical protein